METLIDKFLNGGFGMWIGKGILVYKKYVSLWIFFLSSKLEECLLYSVVCVGIIFYFNYLFYNGYYEWFDNDYSFEV